MTCVRLLWAPLFMIFITSRLLAEVTPTTDTGELSDAISGLMGNAQQSKTLDELSCLRRSTKNSHFASAIAGQNLLLLAPHLQTAFDRAGNMGPKERALFYSQVLVESAFLTHFSESMGLTPQKLGDIQPDHSKNLDRASLISLMKTVSHDQRFQTRPGARHSHNFGDFRGRGLIQLTGCDQFLSAIHYLNLQYNKKPPVWKHYWDTRSKAEIRTAQASEEGDVDAKKYQIGSVCTNEQLEKMKQTYANDPANQGMSLDLFGLLENPVRFAWPGADLEDKKTGLRITGEKLMIDVALAYWKGKCGSHINGFINNPRRSNSAHCPDSGVRGTMNDLEIISHCATKCVKGSTGNKGEVGSWHDRHQWFMHARRCIDNPNSSPP